MRTSDTLTKLAPALVEARKGFRTITKNASNPHFKSKFASYDEIISAVRPSLTANGLSILQSGVRLEDGSASIEVETMLLHDSGEYIANVVCMPMVKQDPQGAGSAITYGRRYGLSALLSLATDEDDDGNSATEHVPAAQPARTQRPAPSNDITEPQRQLLGKLAKSSVLSDTERARLLAVDDKAKAKKAIDWATEEIAARKATAPAEEVAA